MDTNINIKIETSDAALVDLARRLGALEERVKVMHADFQAAVVRLDAATTAVGVRLDKLAAQIAGGITAEEAAPIVAELTRLGDTLEAMGKDPANPVPVPV